MPDLLRLAELADCDLRTIATYYSDRRATMRPRNRRRIERALAALAEMKPEAA